jgi:hypothetical protein
LLAILCKQPLLMANRLALNPSKTEVLWITTPRRRHLISRVPFIFDQTHIIPSAEVRLLGVLLDESLTFDSHISNVTRIAFHQLRRIKAIRRHIPTSAMIQLMRALVITRIDYCNSLLWGLPDSQLSRLQRVLNASARIVFRARWGEHVTPLLRDRLHWLRVSERVIYKRCSFTFRALNDPTCPVYLVELLHRPLLTDRRRQLRSSNRVQLLVPPPAKTVKFGERTITRGNPILWNALPDNVTKATSFESFAKRLKTYLFGLSFSCSV